MKYLKQNMVLKLLVSLAFGVASFYDSRLIFTDDIFATPDKVFFLPVTAKALISLIIGFVAAYAVITLLQFLQDKLHINYDRVALKPGKKEYLIWLAVFALLIVAWLPYILSYFPGGVYPDTATCIGQARSGEYNNQQPLLYSFIFKLCILIAGDLNAVMLFSILQLVFMAGCFSYIIFRLYLHKVNKPVLIALFAYFALFNLVPTYVVSLWKDSLYSVALLMYIFLFIERVVLRAESTAASLPTSVESGKNASVANTTGHKVFDIISLIIWMVLTVFLRNNGIYVMLLTLIVMVITFHKDIFTHKTAAKPASENKKSDNASTQDDVQSSKNSGKITSTGWMIISTAIVLVICYMIQGPLFSKLKLNGPFVENLGVLQQQVAYVQVIGGEMTPEQEAFLNQVCPLDTMKAFYRPFDVDVIKWCEQYDNEFLEANKVEFLKVWAGMLKNNPKLYVDAYLYITLGYWDPYKQMDISYTNMEMWNDLKEVDRYWQKDLLNGALRDKLTPKTLISSAAFLFATLALFVLAVNKKDKSFTAFIPALGTYLTVFIATPLAFALRYVYIVVLTLPIFIIISFINTKKAD